MRFLICSDLHLESVPWGLEAKYGQEATIPTILAAAKREGCDFIMNLGDFMMPSKYGDPAALLKAWFDTEAFAGERYVALGNHDVELDTKATCITKYKMPGKYYAFDRGGWHFVVLDPQNVCMANDIVLESGKTYYMDASLSTTFDGQGHTLTLPAGAMVTTSKTSGRYVGLIAALLGGGAKVTGVTLDVRGTLSGDSTGTVAGTMVYNKNATATLENVRVYLAPESVLQGTANGCGVLVGIYNGAYGKVSANVCVGLDSGVTLKGKNATTYKLPSGATLYKGNTVTTNYGTGSGLYCLGAQEGIAEDGRLTLMEIEALVVSAAKAEGWTLAREGNTVTVSEGPGGICSLTYGLEGFEGVEIPVSFTPMALADLPEGVTATPGQKSLLMAAAAKAALPVPATVTFRTGAKQPTLDALEVFEGILRADDETKALIVGYDFGISNVTVTKNEETGTLMVAATLRVQNDLGQPASFAEGARVDVVRTSDGSSLLGQPLALSSGLTGGEVVCSFPLDGATELFRARIEKAGE